jgi:hypothetical protein
MRDGWHWWTMVMDDCGADCKCMAVMDDVCVSDGLRWWMMVMADCGADCQWIAVMDDSDGCVSVMDYADEYWMTKTPTCLTMRDG